MFLTRSVTAHTSKQAKGTAIVSILRNSSMRRKGKGRKLSPELAGALVGGCCSHVAGHLTRVGGLCIVMAGLAMTRSYFHLWSVKSFVYYLVGWLVVIYLGAYFR